MSAEGIHGSSVDECFEHPLVAHAQIDPIAQIEQRAERTILMARVDDRVDCGASDIANAAKAEADLRVADHCELVA